MLRLDLEGVGVSLINQRMVEVVYLSLRKLELEYSRTDTAQSVTLTCGIIQVDNQLHDAIYPVALQPSPLPKDESMTVPPPTIQASVIFLNDQGWQRDQNILFPTNMQFRTRRFIHQVRVSTSTISDYSPRRGFPPHYLRHDEDGECSMGGT